MKDNTARRLLKWARDFNDQKIIKEHQMKEQNEKPECGINTCPIIEGQTTISECPKCGKELNKIS